MVKKVNHLLSLFAIFILLVAFTVSIHAFFPHNQGREANVGSFNAIDYSENWTLEFDGETSKVTLPVNLRNSEGKSIILKKKLPQELHTGMTMSVRANLEDVYIYVNGELREKYSPQEYSKILYYHSPSAYVITEFTEEDSAGEVSVAIMSKKDVAVLSPIRLGYGNNTWYEVIYANTRIFVVAIILLFLGIVAIIAHFLLKNHISGRKEIFYLSFIMCCIALWIMGESGIRQIIYRRPSLSNIFTYLCIGVVGIFISKYFNEIQGHRYEKGYVVLTSVMALQIIADVVLVLTKLVPFYETLMFSHLWMIVGIVMCLINVIKDRMRNEKIHVIISVGILIFILMSILEISYFYTETDHKFGAYVGIGLVALMVCNVIQFFLDEIEETKARAAQKSKNMLQTIQTIAKTIDSKDSYTGGHSARVGDYAALLADKVRDIYEFSDEDVENIRYIGQMHDIGKIGIPDSILNKPGRLTDEEFAIMKSHTTIGSEVMSEMTSVEGLTEGIRSHHERYDGKGYPDGLAGENIPLVGRILCIADSYDAMTTNRVYRAKLSGEEVLSELKRCSGTQFDPILVEKFCELLEEKEASEE